MSAITDVLAKIAPTAATLLLGPFAGMATEAIGSALGMPDATQDKIKDILQSGNMTGDQLAAIKQAELALKAKLAELGIKPEELAVQDRASARQMQVSTRSRVPGLLAALVTAGFFAILIGMMLGKLNVANEQALLILLGALASGWGAVMNFYFGSSADSHAKTQLMAQMRPGAEQAPAPVETATPTLRGRS